MLRLIALVELTDKALSLRDDRRRTDLTAGRHPVDPGDGLVVQPLVDRVRRTYEAAAVYQLINVRDERAVQAEDVADALFKHGRVADGRARYLTTDTQLNTNKPVGDWISAPRPNVVVVATRVGPTTFCMDPNIFGLSAIQAEL